MPLSKISYAEGVREALAEEMERDDEVFLLGEDIAEAGGVFGVTKGLVERFGPERVLDTPISEEALVGAGVGAALMGGRPVVEIMFGDFVTLAMDMIVNQAAKIHYMTGGSLHVPLVVRMVTGTAGATAAQHSQSLEAWFTHVPGLKVLAPAFPGDAKGLMKTAIRDPDPVVFFEHKQLYRQRQTVADDAGPLPMGSARVCRQGGDVTVVSYLQTVHEALKAADQVADEGLSVEVIDARSLVPFDYETLFSSVEKTGHLVIAHEAPQRSGFGAELAASAAQACFASLEAPILRVCGQDTPMPYAPELEGYVVPDARRIADALRGVRSGGRDG